MTDPCKIGGEKDDAIIKELKKQLEDKQKETSKLKEEAQGKETEVNKLKKENEELKN